MWLPGLYMLNVGPKHLTLWEIIMKIARCVTPALLLALVSPIGLTAQAQYDQDDPPTRVARLSFLGGSVSLRPAGMDDWTDASVNYPLSSGDDLWSDADGRTEI